MEGGSRAHPRRAWIASVATVLAPLMVAPAISLARDLRLQESGTLPPPPPITPATPITPPATAVIPSATPTWTHAPEPTLTPSSTLTPTASRTVMPTLGETGGPEPKPTHTLPPSQTPASAPTQGQGEPQCLSSVLGTVSDPGTGAPQPEVIVRLESSQGTVWALGQTDTNGAYTFGGLC